jgi:hypothetical protein
MASSFALGGSFGSIPSYGGYGGSLNMQGLADQINQGSLAGRYGVDQQDYQKYKDLYGDDASLMYMIDRMDKRTAEQNDSKRLQERFDVLLPFYQKIGEQSQKFGMQSNLLGAGLSAIKSIPETINAFRAIPLQGLYQQTQNTPNIFAAYGSGRPGFSGIRGRLGAA